MTDVSPTWTWVDEGRSYLRFTSEADGTLSVEAAGYDGILSELREMPYKEFRALADVMHEHHLALWAEEIKIPTARLARRVRALSGAGPGDLARLFQSVGSGAYMAWCMGARMAPSDRERLEHILDVLGKMEFDPHLGRKHAFFGHPYPLPSLYERLMNELPR